MNAEEAATKISSILRLALDDGVEIKNIDVTLCDKASGTFAVEAEFEVVDADDQVLDVELVKYEPGKRLLLNIPDWVWLK